MTRTLYYDFMWLDTSAFSVIDFGTEFDTYQVDEMQSISIKGSHLGAQINYFQSRIQYIEQWEI